jgi:D-alanine-D-alanine ligase/UDP-N-acetylmuramate--alanine ligase
MTHSTDQSSSDDEGVPLGRPKLQRIAIVHTNVLRENYPTEQEYLSDFDVVERATDIKKLLEEHGFTVVLLPWDPIVVEKIREYSPEVIINMVETVDGDTLKADSAFKTLALLNIPYTGVNTEGFVLNCYKQLFKERLLKHHVSTPEYTVVDSMEHFAPITISPLLPAMVKLNTHMGGSIGMDDTAICTDLEQAKTRCEAIIKTYKSKALVERYIKGKELTGIVIEYSGGTHKAFFGQKKFTGDYHFCSWKAVWADDDSYNYDGAYPDPGNKLRDLCVGGFVACGARGYAKFDILVDENDTPYIVDINPNCSFGMHDSAIDIVPSLYGHTFLETLYAVINTGIRYHEKRALEVMPKKELYLST